MHNTGKNIPSTGRELLDELAETVERANQLAQAINVQIVAGEGLTIGQGAQLLKMRESMVKFLKGFACDLALVAEGKAPANFSYNNI